MSDSLYTIRNYQPADFDKYVLLRTEAERLEPTGYGTSPQMLRDNLKRPNYSPELDLFLVEVVGDMVGYLDVTPELKIGRVILDCRIHPDYRRRGLAAKLLGYAGRRAKELGTKIAHVNIARDNVTGKSVLSKLGFKSVRRFLHLRLDIAQVNQYESHQTALQYRHMRPGEEEKLTQIQNHCFAGAWGYNPSPVEEVTYRTHLSNCSPHDVVLAYDRDQLIGYCWTRVIPQVVPDERKGQIFMLGVDPDYRGRGAGKGVLLAGLYHLKSLGFEVAELTVDSENKVACNLYRSVGFEVGTSSLWYEKEIG